MIALVVRLLFRLGPLSPGPLVVADNWDGFGARVHGIMNALSFAKQVGSPFRFEWSVREEFPEIAGQIHFFSDEFIRRYRITTEELESLTKISFGGFRSLLVDALIPWRRNRSSQTFLQACSRFHVNTFPGLSRERALAEFAGSLHVNDFAPEVYELLRAVESTVRANAVPLCVIHLRFGDLVTGDWKQYVPSSKYVPAIAASKIVRRLRTEGWRVLVVTDSSEALDLVGEDAKSCGVEDLERLRAAYSSSDKDHRMYLDLFLMRSAAMVVAPMQSAFSLLGAHMGGKEPVDAWSLISGDEQRNALRQLISHPVDVGPAGRFVANVAARDLYSLLTRLSGEIDFEEMVSGLERAIQFDPTYVGALSTMALFEAAAGRVDKAQRYSERAVVAARASKVHTDPLVLALTAAVVSSSAAVARERDRCHPSVARECFAELSELSPYQVDSLAAVRLAERWLASAVRWAEGQGCPVRFNESEIRRSVAEESIRPVITPHGDEELFIGVLRRLDRWVTSPHMVESR